MQKLFNVEKYRGEKVNLSKSLAAEGANIVLQQI
jgi:hypothetical protein